MLKDNNYPKLGGLSRYTLDKATFNSWNTSIVQPENNFPEIKILKNSLNLTNKIYLSILTNVLQI